MIKIMSFNLRYGAAPDGENRWERRKNLALDRIRVFTPDLLALQECRDDADQAGFVRAQLGEYEFIGVRRGGTGDTRLEMAPLLFRKDAFDELDRGHFWLSKTPGVPGSADWNSAFPRTVTWVRLRDKQAPGKELVFASTHFDYNNAEVILQSAKLLRLWIDRLDSLPVIAAGDFNTAKGTPPYLVLIQGSQPGARRLVDAYEAVSPGQPAGTFHGFGSLKAPEAIDWILASEEFRPVSAQIDQTRAGKLYPSDHFPLAAEFEWR